MRHTLLAIAVLAGVATLARPGAGQVLRGRVVDDQTGAPVSNAYIGLFTRSTSRLVAEADADSLGRFRIIVERPDTFRVRIERIGYQPLSVDSIHVGEDREVMVEFRMGLDAVPLEPVRVLGNNRYDWSRLREYYDRLERMKRLGVGTFVTREDLELWTLSSVTDVLRHSVATLQLVGRDGVVAFHRNGRECLPDIYVDGVLTNRTFNVSPDEYVRPDDVEGIEIYRGLTQMPGEYVDTEDCGVILLWTRRGFDEGQPFSWKRLLIASGITGLIYLLLR